MRRSTGQASAPETAARLRSLPAFVRRRITTLVQLPEKSATWKWRPGVVLAHKASQRRAILACGIDVHGDAVYLVQTERGRVNVKGAAAGNLEYGPVVGQVDLVGFNFFGEGTLDRAVRCESARRAARSRARKECAR